MLRYCSLKEIQINELDIVPHSSCYLMTRTMTLVVYNLMVYPRLFTGDESVKSAAVSNFVIQILLHVEQVSSISIYDIRIKLVIVS